MKVKRLSIKNIGLHQDTIIEIDKPLILFYGSLAAGKTTVLNAVKWVCGGGYPSDIIRHGEQEASITLEFENGSITREWYRAKNGDTTDRPIIFIRDGKPVRGRVVDQIKRLLNPYLLDNEFLLRMNERERREYFVDLFAIDTSELDAQLKASATDAQELRATIKAYGTIEVTPVELMDVEGVRAELAQIRTAYQTTKTSYDAEVARITKECQDSLRTIDSANTDVLIHNSKVASTIGMVQDLEKEILRLQTLRSEKMQWLQENPKRETVLPGPAPVMPNPPEAPDTSELEAMVSKAEANKVLYAQYQDQLKRLSDKAIDEKALADLEARQKEIKRQKIAKLQAIETGGIQNLSFDEDGNFVYENTTASMLSTSQIMRLSGELSSLYPTGFGLELIDRAESLGKSIFQFVERAEREQKSILATIVGESPAVVPENIGVFVVSEGTVTNVVEPADGVPTWAR